MESEGKEGEMEGRVRKGEEGEREAQAGVRGRWGMES